ncbi:MAG: DNA translocase FtsK, partial [Planctomycetota bacterium]
GGVVGVVLASRLFENFNYTGATIILAFGIVVSLMLLFNVTPVSPFLKESDEPESVDSHDPEPKETKAVPIPETNILIRRRNKPKGELHPEDKEEKRETEQRPPLEKIKVTADSPKAEQAGEQEDTALHAKKVMETKDSPYLLPSYDLLEELPKKQGEEDWSQITQRAHVLKNTLEQFNIQSEVVEIQKGPVITMYELELAPGTKVGKVVSLSDDLAIALKSPSVRIVAPLLGKSSIGVEVPNIKREVVVLRELLESSEELRKKMSIPLLVGKDVAGNPVISDLAAMPHLLIAGTTGSGKSVCLNSIILSILFLRYPSEVQLLLVDPKMVEFSLFKEIPHLISPVVTDMKKAAAVLEWAVNKMEERYALLASVGVKHINGYNRLGQFEIKKRLNPEGDVNLDDVPFYLPHIVIVVDELADLMMVASREVEGSVIRLSQKSRAVGIHLILATQRPSVDVITGLIKSNLPSRISFYVASKVDSRTILDQNGAEKLLGGGDMLFSPPGTSKLVRVQGAYVSDDEVRDVVEYLKNCSTPQYSSELKQWKGAVDKENDARDNLYQEAVRIVLESQRGSVSLLQRRLEIGYSRAAKLIDLMAENGIVGEYKGSQAREVFLTLEDWEAQMSRMRPDESDNA